MRQPFRFKQFSITDEHSAMKVGTDAVLLGALVQAGNALSILDIGTGSGILALMLAQKSNAEIDGIDIHEASCKDAEKNFSESAWKTRLRVYHTSLNELAKRSRKKFDLIVTNPPFFNYCLKPPSFDKILAKHSAGMSHSELLQGVRKLLKDTGQFWVILPFTEGKVFLDLAESCSLYMNKEILIRPKSGKPVNRTVMEFRWTKPIHTQCTEVSIRNEYGSYHEDYMRLTEGYYLHLKSGRNA